MSEALAFTGPRLEELPIADATVHDFWSETMKELAAHLGGQATLQLVNRWGGLHVYVPLNPKNHPFAPVIGEAAEAEFCRVYAMEYFYVPIGKRELLAAKAPPILAAFAAGEISASFAAWTLRTQRSTIFAMKRKGWLATPAIKSARPKPAPKRQLEMFDPALASGTGRKAA